ncbi:hypothetical protein [Listeria monocytogenes]|uniref:hypothetical protein n=1 Tax=Listeria monocytogenes TaxID=1639 RepID=UPI003F9CA9E0
MENQNKIYDLEIILEKLSEDTYFKNRIWKLTKQFGVDRSQAESYLLSASFGVLLKEPALPLHKVCNRAYRTAAQEVMFERGAVRKSSGYEWHHVNIEPTILENILASPAEEEEPEIIPNSHAEAISIANLHFRSDQARFVKELLISGESKYLADNKIEKKVLNQKIKRLAESASKKSYPVANHFDNVRQHNLEILGDLEEAFLNNSLEDVAAIIKDNCNINLMTDVLDNVVWQQQLIEDMGNSIKSEEVYKLIANVIKLQAQLSQPKQQTAPLLTADELAERQAENKKITDTYNNFVNGTADNIEVTYDDDCQLLADLSFFHVFGSSTVLIVDRNGREVKRYDAIVYQKLMEEVDLL